MPNIFDHTMFTVTKKDNGKIIMVTEASNLGHNYMGRVFDDACDVGFNVKGKKSAVTFTLIRRVRDDEGDLLVEIFIPYNPKRIPELNNVEIHVLND